MQSTWQGPGLQADASLVAIFANAEILGKLLFGKETHVVSTMACLLIASFELEQHDLSRIIGLLCMAMGEISLYDLTSSLRPPVCVSVVMSDQSFEISLRLDTLSPMITPEALTSYLKVLVRAAPTPTNFMPLGSLATVSVGDRLSSARCAACKSLAEVLVSF